MKKLIVFFFIILCLAAVATLRSQPITTPPAFVQDPTPSVLPSYNNDYANWKNAGLVKIGGIPTRNTQCGATVTTSGLTPPQTNDDFQKITAAIAACSAGQVVQLAAGTFQIAFSELPIILNKGITLRGTGNCTQAGSDTSGVIVPYCQTVINGYDGPQPKYVNGGQCGVTFSSTTACNTSSVAIILLGATGPNNFGWAGCIYAGASSANPTTSNCGTTLAADVAQGATTVQVASTTNFPVPGWVLIDENPLDIGTSVANPIPCAAGPCTNIQASANAFSTSGSPRVNRWVGNDNGATDCFWYFCPDRTQEIHRVIAKGTSCPGVGCTLTFDSPVSIAFRQSASHDARVYWPTTGNPPTTPTPFVEQAGIENLSLTRMNGGVQFLQCAYCWLKGVEFGGWIKGIQIDQSARVQVTGSYIHDCYDCNNSGNEYPIDIRMASTEVLIDNNIIWKTGKGMTGRSSSTNVIAYNYQDATFYQPPSGVPGDWWIEAGVNGSHAAGTHSWLLEGNDAVNCDDDDTHGGSTYHVYYRNWCRGIRSTFTDPATGQTVNDSQGIGYQNGVQTTTGPQRAIGPMAYNYFHAYVGNVLGPIGISTNQTWVYNGIPTGGLAYTAPAIWISGWAGDRVDNDGTHSDSNLDGVSHTFLFKHGNYDFVNASIVDFQTGFARVLPSSFYLSQRPSYFGPSGTNCTYPWPWVTPTSGTVIRTASGAGCAANTPGLPAKARWLAGTPFVQP